MNPLIADFEISLVRPDNLQGDTKYPHIFMCLFDCVPSMVELPDVYVKVSDFLSVINSANGFNLVKFVSSERGIYKVAYVHEKNQILVICDIDTITSEENFVLEDIDENVLSDDGVRVVTDINFVVNPEYHKEAHRLSSELHELRMRYKNERVPTVSFIATGEMGELYLNDFSYDKEQSKSFDFDLNLHYGDGFADKYNKLMELTTNTTKGIMMLYGESGTGKSWLIRRMVKDFISQDKRVVFVNSNMVSMLLSPQAHEFFADTANYLNEWDEEGRCYRRLKNIVFILEDCDQFITPRGEMGLDSSVATFLNTSDGIPNDFINFQYVLSFNKSIHEVDEALYRKGRGIFAHNFKPLSEENAIRLAKHIGVKEELVEKIDGDMKSAEVYDMLNPEENNILLSDIFDEVGSQHMGFGNR